LNELIRRVASFPVKSYNVISTRGTVPFDERADKAISRLGRDGEWRHWSIGSTIEFMCEEGKRLQEIAGAQIEAAEDLYLIDGAIAEPVLPREQVMINRATKMRRDADAVMPFLKERAFVKEMALFRKKPLSDDSPAFQSQEAQRLSQATKDFVEEPVFQEMCNGSGGAVRLLKSVDEGSSVYCSLQTNPEDVKRAIQPVVATGFRWGERFSNLFRRSSAGGLSRFATNEQIQA
jgi:hypothetical protein